MPANPAPNVKTLSGSGTTEMNAPVVGPMDSGDPPKLAPVAPGPTANSISVMPICVAENPILRTLMGTDRGIANGPEG